MNTVTLNKTEYQRLVRKQESLERDVRRLESVVKVNLEDEVASEVKAKLEKISKPMDRGGGKRFRSAREFSRHLKTL